MEQISKLFWVEMLVALTRNYPGKFVIEREREAKIVNSLPKYNVYLDYPQPNNFLFKKKNRGVYLMSLFYVLVTKFFIKKKRKLISGNKNRPYELLKKN